MKMVKERKKETHYVLYYLPLINSLFSVSKVKWFFYDKITLFVISGCLKWLSTADNPNKLDMRLIPENNGCLKTERTAGTKKKTTKAVTWWKGTNFARKPDICWGIGVMWMACYANARCSPTRHWPVKVLTVFTN